ncbi:MAG: N-acetylmuramoyl-L-alanine amidase [Deltaproteobacteria bacterium]|nr:N-acetylmuramoyl-L-alanine amidase [Deltaproteobacteria bacterium]
MLLMLLSLACSEPASHPAPPPPAPAAPPAAPVWPEAGAPLARVVQRFPGNFNVHRVYLDPGHGAPGNRGNVGVLCQVEQEENLAMSLELRDHLVHTGRFEVRLARAGDAHPGYRARVAEAEAWGAEVYLSLHTDARGAAAPWIAPDGQRCLRGLGSVGPSVLWSDEGAAPARRERLATRLAEAMTATGLPPYSGEDYVGLYDKTAPGVFVDRHQPGSRIFVLRAPSMPSAIVETHNALHLDEVARWEEPATRAAFCDAVTAALIAFLASP